MKKVIMIYDLKGDDSRRIGFNRKLFQYTIQSHNGKYKTVSKGALKKYAKPVRSVVIFDKKDVDKVKKVLKESKIECKLYEVHKEIK